MKELSIEEKAKAYDEAIEFVKNVYDFSNDPEEKKRIEQIFPELMESEDEKIRKVLIDYFKRYKEQEECSIKTFYGIPTDDILAWLEKQGGITKLSDEEQNKFAKGVLTSCALSFIDYLDAHKYEGKMCVSNGECEDIENAFHNAMWDRLHRYYCKYIEKQGKQKSADKAEPKFHEGEWLCENESNNYARFIQILEIVNVQGKDRYRISRDIHSDEDIVEFDFVEKYYHKFDIQDAKDGDVLYTPKGCGVEGIFLIEGWKKVKDTGRTLCSDIGYRVEDDEIIVGGLGAIWWKGVIDLFYPATKEQRDLLFQKMKEAGYEWDAEKKELKKIEQKPDELIKDYDFHGVKIVPKFKKGDLIKNKKSGETLTIESFSYDTGLYTHKGGQFPITIQDNWELVEQKPKELFDIPENGIENDVSVTSRMEHVPEHLKPIAKFILEYAHWNLHKDEWNHPVPEVPLFRVLDALVQEGKLYQEACSCVEQKPTWSEEDETVLSNLIWALKEDMVLADDRDEYVSWLEGLKNKVQPQPKQEWSEEDELMCESIIDMLELTNGAAQMKIDWLKSFKDRVIPQPKQEWKQEKTDNLTDFENAMMHIGNSFFGDNAGLDPNDTNAIKEQANLLLELVPKHEWSKKDERMLNDIIKDLVYPWNEYIPDRIEYEIKWLKNKLKSLRPQNTWKPSEEQMEALHYVTNFDYGGYKAMLVSLYEQLKKLKEE